MRIDGAAVGAALLVLGVATTAPAADAGRGKQLYETRCAPCHGSQGRGDGPAAAAITPPPRNFRDGAFWVGRGDDQLAGVIRNGKPGSLMAPFRDVLSEAEIADVVTYLHGFRPAER